MTYRGDLMELGIRGQFHTWWENSPGLVGVTVGAGLLLASWPWISTFMCLQGWHLWPFCSCVVRQSAKVQRQEVTGLSYVASRQRVRLEAEPCPMCEQFLQASFPF